MSLSKYIKIICTLFVSLSLLMSAYLSGQHFYNTALPKILQQHIVGALKKNCPTCTIELKDVDLQFLSKSITLNHFYYASGTVDTTLFEIRAPQITTHPSLSKLIQAHLFFSEIVVQSAVVTITDGDHKTPADSTSENDHRFEQAAAGFNRITLTDATLTYFENHHHQVAPLLLMSINGHLEVGKTEIRTLLNGIIEKSGTFTLDVSLPPRLANIDLSAELKVSNLNLSELNPYFLPVNGVLLTGILHLGESSVKISKNHLKGWLSVKYKNLNIQFKKTTRRSSTLAFFSNLKRSITLIPENLDHLKSEQSKVIDLQRRPQEAVIAFIARGMSKAIFNIVDE